MIEYQIKYKDTQRSSGDEDNQIKGISITDLGTYGLAKDPVTTNVTMGFASSAVIINANDTVSTYDELVAFFTGANGRKIRVSGGSTDGDYTIISDPTFTAPVLTPFLIHGTVHFNIDSAPVPGTAAVDGVQFEDITTPDIVQLQGSGSPDVLQIIDNNEDKFTTIRAKQLTAQFIATSSVDVNTFVKGEDNKWYVESWTNTRDNIDFKGFLITDDLQQPFLPVEGNIVCTLLATDRLGTLKNVQLTDDSKVIPQGKWKISQYLSWMLKKTGMSLPIYVVNNIKPGSGSFTTDAQFDLSDVRNVGMNDNITSQRFFYPGQRVRITGSTSNDGTYTVLQNILFGIRLIYFDATFTAETTSNVVFEDVTSDTHLYDEVYLDAKSFEGSEVNTTINCYDGLDLILKDSCFIEQSKGSWWIYRVAEIEGISVKVAHFEADGTFVDIQTKTYSKSIGRTETIKWAEASQLQRFRRAYSHIKETYRYQFPIETVCNFDFSRGDFIANLSDVTIGVDVYNASSYAIECWNNTHSPFTPGQTTPSPSFQAYIKRLFQNGYEKQRFAVLPTTPSGTDFLESQPIVITQGDKFSVSVDFAWSANAASGSVNLASIMYVTLKGDDDTNWFLDVNDPAVKENKWISAGSGATWSPLNGVGMSWGAADVDETAFRTLSAAAAAAPVSGLLRFALISIGSVSGTLDDKDMYYNNFQFNYIPFINGSYQKYTGQTHTVSQVGNYNAIRENEVKMSDSPRNIFKGAMFFFNGTSYFLTKVFYDSFKFPTPTGDDLKPYGEIQSQDVWTQFNREFRIFSGTLRGLDSDVQDSDSLPDGPDLIHQYLLTDSNESTDNKVFLMISYEQDRKSQLTQSTLIEVFDSVEGKTPGDHVFKYLTE